MSGPMGKTAKDKITGFTGTITGRSEYINGCVHLMLEAKAKVGEKPVHAWFDEDRCILTGRSNPQKRMTKKPGGPMPHSI